MFSRKKQRKEDVEALEAAQRQIFDDVMSKLYSLGKPGAPITPEVTGAARDLAKADAIERLRPLGANEPGVMMATLDMYTQVGDKIGRMLDLAVRTKAAPSLRNSAHRHVSAPDSGRSGRSTRTPGAGWRGPGRDGHR